MMSERICIHVFDVVVWSPRIHASSAASPYHLAAAYLAAAFATKIVVAA
jgi:hypothetical protein